MTDSTLRTISRLLVANRGEIARRIFRTCRTEGISTVAVFADADVDSRHAQEADVAVRLPGNTPSETYLRGELIIDAARRSGADAVHPGYGFLSENAEFAQAVLDAGLIWVGPPVESIEAMGSKIAAKEQMAAAGVPVMADLDPTSITEQDLPVLVKASAGGGGRGMRVVRSVQDLPTALEAARSEAASAFGDSAVFCEPYVEQAHHIEVQVLADEYGTVWTLGERECSIQRRHQKVVGESPSPMVDTAMRDRLNGAARAAAEAVGYVGAGTVEFLADASGRFFFLEMNTRLQVEHPVTECVTGLDLVQWQLRIAAGEQLPVEGPPAAHGHAIEVRLYAEDPAEGWRPSSGRLHTFSVPGVETEFSRPGLGGVRLDSAVVAGDEVTVHYDPMLAKVIAWAPTRQAASQRLARALAAASIHGLRTNRDLLVRVLEHPQFLAGATDTGFFESIGLETLSAPLAGAEVEELSASVAAIAEMANERSRAVVQQTLPPAWRNIRSQDRTRRYRTAAGEVVGSYRTDWSGRISTGSARVLQCSPEHVRLDVEGVVHQFAVRILDDLVCVDSALGPVTLERVPLFPDVEEQLIAGSLTAPTPGTVVAVHVSEGDRVAAGTSLVVLEAMKMQHTITATTNGIVGSVHVSHGQQVETGQLLIVVEDEADAGEQTV